MRKAIIALMVCGCAAEADSYPWPDPDRRPVMVSYGLSPEPDLFGWAIRTMARWNAARGCYPGSGCELYLDEQSGIPVEYVAEIIQLGADLKPLLDENGTPKKASGVANHAEFPYRAGMRWISVQLADDIDDPERVLMHELGHVLGVFEHTATGVTLSFDGTLTHGRAKALDYWTINQEVLDVVCAATFCMEQNPEEPIE